MKFTSIYLSSPAGLLPVCRPSCFVFIWLSSSPSYTFFYCFKSDTNLHAFFFFAPAFHCSMTLGMESGKISDDQISASTSFYDSRWLPRQARLNNNDNAWTPSEDSNKEYIQVRLYLHYLQEAHVRPFRHEADFLQNMKTYREFVCVWKWLFPLWYNLSIYHRLEPSPPTFGTGHNQDKSLCHVSNME